MGCLGLHFSLDAQQVEAIEAIEDEDERVSHVQDEFEEQLWTADPSRAQETDKAWDGIHRALTDGSLSWGDGTPLSQAILGGELLYEEDDYILSLKSPDEVKQIAAALREVTRERLRAGYDRIDAKSYGGELSDRDFEYTWTWFEKLVGFYERAAAAGRFVLFTADQ